jgi:hypothetical protein
MLALNQVFFFFFDGVLPMGPSFQILSGEPQHSMLGLQHVRLVYSVGLIPPQLREVVCR